MYVKIRNGDKNEYKDVYFNQDDIVAARKIVKNFFENIREKTKKKNKTSLYYTTLLVANVLTSQLLEEMGPENLKLLLKEGKFYE